MLQTYSEHSPTAFDPKGAFLLEQQDWLVCPVIQTRDSGPFELSNFAAMEKILADVDPEEQDFEVHRFGHWGPGWYEIIIVRPGTKAHIAAEESAEALEDYPLLDEDDHSNRELEAAQEVWEACLNLSEKIDLCRKAGISVFSARSECIPPNDPGYIFERCSVE